MIKISQALANALLKGGTIDGKLGSGFIYIFAGAEPANADAALNMATTHTQLVKVTADVVAVDAGATGLTFDSAAASGALPKNPAETWHGKINFDGKDAASAGVSPLTAIFYRFCNAADTGRGAGDGTTFRIQGTVKVSGGDINLSSVSLSDNGSNTQGLAAYEVRMATQ